MAFRGADKEFKVVNLLSREKGPTATVAFFLWCRMATLNRVLYLTLRDLPLFVRTKPVLNLAVGKACKVESNDRMTLISCKLLMAHFERNSEGLSRMKAKNKG